MKTNTKTTEICQKQKQFGFQKGDVRKLFETKKQTLRKEKTKHNDRKKPTKNLFQKGVDGQKAKKNGI